MTSVRVTLSVWHTEPELGSSISAAILCLRFTFFSLSRAPGIYFAPESQRARRVK